MERRTFLGAAAAGAFSAASAQPKVYGAAPSNRATVTDQSGRLAGYTLGELRDLYLYNNLNKNTKHLEELKRTVTFEPHATRAENFHHPRHLMRGLLSIERMIQRGGRVSELFG